MKVETVEIQTEAGKVVINKDDYDKEKHTLYSEATQKPKIVTRSKRRKAE